jgi:c(7)-type cytochrome triheme protein
VIFYRVRRFCVSIVVDLIRAGRHRNRKNHGRGSLKHQAYVTWLSVLLVEALVVFGMITCATTTKKTGPGAGKAPAEEVEPQLRFSHKVHAEQAECEGCHSTVKTSAKAGEPKLSVCLVCHDSMQSTEPQNQIEEKKLLTYYAKLNKEIHWPYLGSLAPGVFFSHKVHVVEAELDCKDCHGDIAQTDALPKKLPYPYNHTLCGQCHDTSQDMNGCKTCHPR